MDGKTRWKLALVFNKICYLLSHVYPPHPKLHILPKLSYHISRSECLSIRGLTSSYQAKHVANNVNLSHLGWKCWIFGLKQTSFDDKYQPECLEVGSSSSTTVTKWFDKWKQRTRVPKNTASSSGRGIWTHKMSHNVSRKYGNKMSLSQEKAKQASWKWPKIFMSVTREPFCLVLFR